MAVYKVCIDESCTNKRFMVFGGVIIRQDIASRLVQWHENWREKNGIKDEIKWTKTTASRLSRYVDFASRGIRYSQRSVLTIRTFVFDRQLPILGELRKEFGEDILYHGLMQRFIINAFIPCLDPGDRLIVHLDKRTSSCPLQSLRGHINERISNEYGFLRNRVEALEPRDSRDCHLIQMADLFAGVVAHANNGRLNDQSSRGRAKNELADRVTKHLGMTLTRDTPGQIHGFQSQHYLVRA